MTHPGLAVGFAAYVAGLLALRRVRQGLIAYAWGAFGVAALLVLSAQLGRWYEPLGALQAAILEYLGNLVGLGLSTLEPTRLIVPDPTGWSVLSFGMESSMVIEAAVFAGLLIFYPRFTPAERLLRLAVGLAATFAVNLIRMAVIVAFVALIGKPAVPLTYALVGRLVFFIGIVIVYWKMLTLPTLRIVRRDLEVSGRAAA